MKARNGRSYLYSWIRSLAPDIPEIVVLEQDPADGLSTAERRWIATLRAEGARLTNLTDGGDSGFHPSSETRAKMSAAQRGIPKGPQSAQHRANISAAKRGTVVSAGAREKMSAVRRGVPKSPAHRTAISAAHLGKKKPWLSELNRKRWADPEYKRRVSLAMRESKQQTMSLVVSLETRAKISAANRGKNHTPETRAKISDALRCAYAEGRHTRTVSAETRAKISATNIARRIRKEVVPYA